MRSSSLCTSMSNCVQIVIHVLGTSLYVQIRVQMFCSTFVFGGCRYLGSVPNNTRTPPSLCLRTSVASLHRSAFGVTPLARARVDPNDPHLGQCARRDTPHQEAYDSRKGWSKSKSKSKSTTQVRGALKKLAHNTAVVYQLRASYERTDKWKTLALSCLRSVCLRSVCLISVLSMPSLAKQQ